MPLKYEGLCQQIVYTILIYRVTFGTIGQKEPSLLSEVCGIMIVKGSLGGIEMDLKEISKQSEEVIEELLDITNLKPGSLFVLGGSTSEILGKKVGTAGSLDVAKAVVDPILEAIRKRGLYLAVQGCEHINRALLVEEEAKDKYGLEEVNVIPHEHAGGSIQTYAYQQFKNPVMVENLKGLGHAGLDIGLVLIGMHLRPVVVPVRLSRNKIGEATIVAARTRPKMVGGERAKYKKL
ncbi:TIGR01440 family protein [Thermoanaerobacter uzonensis DSM 18761]|jgi:uncharacterized protein (TIGR01440 family)|uniref:UPF0340 protein SAMN02745195_01866 n=2 Tax=Thermoanaerobacter uzonensis TaxID=447593 RepID=A0A1M4Z132_9THEO|nr:TIGR01440 family protein [Thermoanaerobacter uzonensis DSM 18761]